MKPSVVFAAVFTLTTAVCAQEVVVEAAPAEQGAMPNPKHPEHEALKDLAGTWSSTVKMAAVPGVPGMEKPNEVSGIEHAELTCDGLWLEWTMAGEFMGQPFEGLWLAGFDPFQKQYVSLWVDNHEAKAVEMRGTYDKNTRKWTWSGTCPQGRMRSEIVWKDDDTMVETTWLTPPRGEEMQTMQITRKRSDQKGRPTNASAKVASEDLSPAMRALHEGVGTWEATMTMAVDPTQPPIKEQCKEEVLPICGGKYTWSNFDGSMMGMPFEGHALVGYDAEKDEFVSYWIDSMTPVWAKTTGKYDPESKSITMEGRCRDCFGQPMTMKEVLTFEGKDKRHCKMEFETEQGTQAMEIAYRRVGK